MNVAIGIFLAGAMIIALAGAILMNVKLWELIRESGSPLRRLPPEKRRGILLRATAIYVVVLVEVAVVLIAPFGIRKTLTYFVILPFVALAPAAIIGVGIRGFRGQRQRRPPAA
jgi:hypothetical protein